MHTHSVERAYVDIESGPRFRIGQFVVLNESRWILPIPFTLSRIAVDVVDEFLQLIQAHRSIQLLMQPNDYRLQYVRNRTHMTAREEPDRFRVPVFQQQIKIV